MTISAEVFDGRTNLYRWNTGTLDWVRWDGAVTGGGSGATGLTDAELRASAVPMSLASVPSHPVTNAGAFAVQVSSAPVTAVTGTFFQATQPVSLATAPTTPVTGTFFQATQPISAVSLPSHDVTNAGTFAVQVSSAPTTAVTGTFWQATQPISAVALPLPSDAATQTTLAALNTKVPAQGQALAAASLPVVLTAAQVSTLTPPAAITGFSTETTLAALNTKVTAVNTGAVVVTTLPALVASTANIGDVDVLTMPAITGTVTANAGTNLNTSALALDASISTLNTSVNTLLKPANTLAAVTTVGTVTNLAGQATSYGKTLTYVPVAQGAAGTTVLAAASVSARHKIIGALLTMSAAGTLKFLDGSGDLTGAMDVGATGGFVLPAALLPYQQTATNSALSITTTVGAAKGVVTILTEA